MKMHYTPDATPTTQSLALCNGRRPSARVRQTHDRAAVTCGSCLRILSPSFASEETRAYRLATAFAEKLEAATGETAKIKNREETVAHGYAVDALASVTCEAGDGGEAAYKMLNSGEWGRDGFFIEAVNSAIFAVYAIGERNAEALEDFDGGVCFDCGDAIDFREEPTGHVCRFAERTERVDETTVDVIGFTTMTGVARFRTSTPVDPANRHETIETHLLTPPDFFLGLGKLSNLGERGGRGGLRISGFAQRNAEAPVYLAVCPTCGAGRRGGVAGCAHLEREDKRLVAATETSIESPVERFARENRVSVFAAETGGVTYVAQRGPVVVVNAAPRPFVYDVESGDVTALRRAIDGLDKIADRFVVVARERRLAATLPGRAKKIADEIANLAGDIRATLYDVELANEIAADLRACLRRIDTVALTLREIEDDEPEPPVDPSPIRACDDYDAPLDVSLDADDAPCRRCGLLGSSHDEIDPRPTDSNGSGAPGRSIVGSESPMAAARETAIATGEITPHGAPTTLRLAKVGSTSKRLHAIDEQLDEPTRRRTFTIPVHALCSTPIWVALPVGDLGKSDETLCPDCRREAAARADVRLP